jgi:hypothetical protein
LAKLTESEKFMASALKRKKGTGAQFNKAFSPVALEMGHFARTWNALHETMGVIFAYMISPAAIAIPLVTHSGSL